MLLPCSASCCFNAVAQLLFLLTEALIVMLHPAHGQETPAITEFRRTLESVQRGDSDSVIGTHVDAWKRELGVLSSSFAGEIPMSVVGLFKTMSDQLINHLSPPASQVKGKRKATPPSPYEAYHFLSSHWFTCTRSGCFGARQCKDDKLMSSLLVSCKKGESVQTAMNRTLAESTVACQHCNALCSSGVTRTFEVGQFFVIELRQDFLALEPTAGAAHSAYADLHLFDELQIPVGAPPSSSAASSSSSSSSSSSQITPSRQSVVGMKLIGAICYEAGHNIALIDRDNEGDWWHIEDEAHAKWDDHELPAPFIELLVYARMKSSAQESIAERPAAAPVAVSDAISSTSSSTVATAAPSHSSSALSDHPPSFGVGSNERRVRVRLAMESMAASNTVDEAKLSEIGSDINRFTSQLLLGEGRLPLDRH